jgi:hypothetical protein
MTEEQERGQRWEAYAKKAGFLDDHGICQPGQHERTATSWYTWEACEKALASLAKPQPVGGALTESEQYRMQMAGISTAALGYWKEGDSIHPDYDTLTLRDVAKLYAKYDALFQADLNRRGLAATLSAPVAQPEAVRCHECGNVPADCICAAETHHATPIAAASDDWFKSEVIHAGNAGYAQGLIDGKALAAPAQAAAVPEAEPEWWFAECGDPDYSRLYAHKADALSQISDHGGGTVTALYTHPTPQAAAVPDEFCECPNCANGMGLCHKLEAAAVPEAVEPSYTLDQIADACIQAGINDPMFESLSIYLERERNASRAALSQGDVSGEGEGS